MKCESCLTDHVGEYGSGRFCCKKCAKSFSTRSKRKEINKAVSKKLSHDHPIRKCEICGVDYNSKRKNQRTCSKKCGTVLSHKNESAREAWSKARIKAIEEGNVGYGIKCEFNNVRCDSALEYAFIKWYLENHPKASIRRFKGYIEKFGIRYQPDFLIDEHIIVEVKYETDAINFALKDKWKGYIESQIIKKKILQSMTEDGYTGLWITNKDIGRSYYRRCLEEIRNRNSIGREPDS